ncbi:ATP-binding protein, partial [Planctomycetota bacterium]
MNAPTFEKLTSMRLNAMAAAWQEQQVDTGVTSLSFDERLAFLVDVEWLSRQNKRIARAMREAKLRLSHACVEDIDYPAA